jgi:hypothetical protein
VGDSAEGEQSLGSAGWTSTVEASESDGLVSASLNSVGGNAFQQARVSACVPQAPVPIRILPGLTRPSSSSLFPENKI